MKRKDDLGIGGSIAMTILFAGMAIFTYQTDSSGNPLAFIPAVGVIVGIFMTIIAYGKSADESARKDQQSIAGNTVVHDSSFGDGDLKMYFDSSSKKLTVCATTTSGANKKEVQYFTSGKNVKTDSYLVALDAECNKLVCAKSNNGTINLRECYLKSELVKLNIEYKKSKPALKAFNDYAFVTDDINEFIAIVTPTQIHVHRYSDIVSISYEENGSDVFNKSLGGAVVGGLLFGGVGAIVGGNTAKATQNKEVRIMSIKILLKSTSNSSIVLKIYEAGKDGSLLETKNLADRNHYEGLMKEVTGIKDIFSIIIDIVDRKVSQQKVSSPIVQSNTGSVADELTKLAKLKDAGILSDEEFNAQKAKLLNL